MSARRRTRQATAATLRRLRVRGRARVHYEHRKAPPGSAPGAMAIPADAAAPRIRTFLYDAASVRERDEVAVEELAALRDAPGVLWVDVTGFGDEAALRRVGELFGIHPLAMADAVNVPQRPKFEDYGDRHLFVTRMACLRSAGEPPAGGRAPADAEADTRHVDLEQVTLVLGPRWVVSFQERPGDVFEPVRQRLRTNAGTVRRQGADYLAYVLLDAIIDGYYPVLEAVGERIDRMGEMVLEHPTRAVLHEIHETRRLLIGLHRVLWRQRDAIASMVREDDDTAPFSAPVRVYVRDVHDHAVQLLDVLETLRDLAVGLLEIYLSILSNRSNEAMMTLTVVATIFIPLTFLAGVYGMNFEHMPELRWRWGYPAVWAVMICVAVALLLWFRRRGWIGRGGD